MEKTTLQIVIEAIDKASGTLGAVGKSLKTTGDTLSDIRKPALAATAAIGGIVIAGIKLSETAGKYESIKDSFKSMTEGMGVGVEDFERKVAEASGGTLDKLTILQGGTRALSLMGRDAFTDFGDQFTKMAELSKKAARATGQDVTYMFDSLITGMSRESKMILDNLGITVDLTQAKKDYAEQLGKSVDELTIVEEKQAVLNHTLGKLEENYANVAVSAGGFSGAMAKMKTEITNAQIEIGEALTPAFNELVRSITPMIKEYVPKLVEKIKALVKWLSELSPTGQKVLLFFLALAPAIVALTTAGLMIIKVITILSSVLKGLGLVLKGIQLAFAVISAHPIVLAIMAIIAVLYLLYKNWDEIKEGLSAIWQTISETAKSIFGGIRDFFSGIWETIKGIFFGAVENIKETITGIIEFLGFFKESIMEIFTTIGNFLKGVLIVWKEILRPIWQPIVEASEEVFDFLTKWFEKVSDFISKTWTAIKDKIKEIWDSISDAIKEVAEAIGSYLEEKFNAIADFFYEIWTKIEERLKAIWDSISSAFTGFMDGLRNAWETIWNWVVEKVQWVYDRIRELVDKIKAIVAPVTDLIKEVGETVSGVGTKVTEGVKGFGRSIWEGAKGLVEIGAGTVGFQKGGIATMPMLARVAETEPEAVIPLSKLGMMRGDINIYIQGGNYLDRKAGEKFAEILGKMLRRELRYQSGY